MAGESDEPEVSGGRPRRQPATIDLKATEIPGSPPSSAPKDKGASETMAGESTAATPGASDTQPATDRAHDGKSSRPDSTELREAPRTGWAFTAAAGIGAILSAVILGALWASGLISIPNASESSQLSAIERQLREIAARPPSPPPPAAPPAPELAQRLAAIEQALGGLRQIEQRLARADSAVAPPAPPPDAAVQERMTRLEGASGALSAQLSDLRSRSDEAVAIAREARARAEAGPAQATGDTASEAELKALAARVGQLEQTARAMQDALAKTAIPPPPADKAMRAAFATTALRAAIERGDAFTTELAAVKALMPGAVGVATIEPFAASGVPTPAALQQAFATVEAEVAKAAAPQPADAGFMDKLQAKAERLIRIRPVDSPQGDDPAAVVSRIAAQLTRADVAAAITEANKLPQEAQPPLGAWLASAKARQAAVEAARALARDALAALGRGAP